MVILMSSPIEGEAHEAQRPDDHPVQVVQEPALSQEPMRGLMKPDQHSMHEMAHEQREGHGQPNPAVKDREPKRDLGGEKCGADQRKGCPADPVSMGVLVPVAGSALGVPIRLG